jgi:hypothetical protein
MLTFPTLITGTITDLRISAVDGTAFLDNCAALIPYADGNHWIEIYDSSNRMLKGVLKAAGTGETLGDETIDTWTNDGYETLTLSGSDITQAVNSNSSRAMAYKQTGIDSLALAKLVIGSFTLNSGYKTYFTFSSSSPQLSNSTNGKQIIDSTMAAGTYYGTMTVASSYSGFLMPINANGDWAATGNSFKQVLAPSSSGVTIVSAKGGDIYNFASKDASFTYNADSYRYAIYDTLKVSRPTRYMGVSTHNI